MVRYTYRIGNGTSYREPPLTSVPLLLVNILTALFLTFITSSVVWKIDAPKIPFPVFESSFAGFGLGGGGTGN